jgi:hypothetical protein
MLRRSNLVLLSISLVVLVVSSSCGSSVTAGAAVGYASDVTYGGTGSAYTANVKSDLTFTITKKASVSATTVDLTVSGTYTRLSSGILQLTVTSSSDTTNGPSVGAKAYALDVPGYVFMLKPIGSQGGEIIPMVATGSCPSADFSGAWVMMQDSSTSTDYTTQGLVGSFNYTQSTTSGSVGATKYLSDGTSSSGSAQSVGTLTCTNGVGTFPVMNGASPEMYFTNGGGAIVHVVPSVGQTQSIVMVPSAALNVSDFAGTYIGLSFDEGDTTDGTGGSTLPISVTLNSAGTGTGAVITDVTNNTLSTTMTATLTLAQLAAPVNGVLKMTINSGVAQNTICSAAKAIGGTTQNVVFCAGKSPAGAATKLRSYLLVTKRS